MRSSEASNYTLSGESGEKVVLQDFSLPERQIGTLIEGTQVEHAVEVKEVSDVADSAMEAITGMIFCKMQARFQ